MKTVVYQADEKGYSVVLQYEDGEKRFLYSATNNPLDSQGPVLPKGRGVPLETLQRWAKETADDLAEEWGGLAVEASEDLRSCGSEF